MLSIASKPSLMLFKSNKQRENIKNAFYTLYNPKCNNGAFANKYI